MSLLARWLWRAASGSLLASLAFAATAQSATTTFTTSVSRTPDTFVDTSRTETVTLFSTRLVAELDGDPTRWFDQTFAGSIADPIVQAGVLAAQAALQAATPDPLIFAGPVLFDLGVPSFVSSVIGVPTTVGNPVITTTVGVTTTIGSGVGVTILTGNLGNCEGLVPQPFGGLVPVNCTALPADPPASFTVLPGNENFHTNTDYQYEFTREIVTTETYAVVDTWRLLGIPQVAGVGLPLPGSLALLAAGLLALGVARHRARRLA